MQMLVMSDIENIEEFAPESFSPNATRERTQRTFKDFLLIRELAGDLQGVPHGGIVPAEYIVDDGGKIEIVATPEEHIHSDDGQANEPTVLIRRSASNEVESIEFICTCGQRVIVKVDYDVG